MDVLKIKGFERLVNCLIMLINNTLFAIKDKKGKPELIKYKEELERIDEVIPLLCKTITNQLKKTSKLTLKKEKYEKVLKRVRKIKAGINEPLNKNHLSS